MSKVLAILYDIWISGTKLTMTKKACINDIEIKNTDLGSDVATIQVTDPEFLFIEDNIFLEDNSVKIRLGWSNTTYREEFEGYISAIDISFDSTGCPKLTLTCMDNTHIMNRTKKNRTFSNCTNADVVKRVVAEYGYICVIDSNYSFNVQETITQSDQTDIEFITKLAGDEVYPFSARLVGNTFYYVRRGTLQTPKMTLTYRNYPHEIISFSPKINKETKKVEINKSSINTSNKSVSNSKGTVDSSSGSASSNTTPKTQTASSGSDSKGGYTYDPNTKKWTKN